MKNITPIQPPTSDTPKDEELNQKLKTAKSIPLTSLLTPNTYFDFNFGNDWFPAKINAVLPDGKYDISFFYQPNKEKRNLVIKLSSKMSFFREHIYCYNNISTYYESLPEIKEVKLKAEANLKAVNEILVEVSVSGTYAREFISLPFVAE